MWILFVKLFSPAPWWLEPKARRIRQAIGNWPSEALPLTPSTFARMLPPEMTEP